MCSCLYFSSIPAPFATPDYLQGALFFSFADLFQFGKPGVVCIEFVLRLLELFENALAKSRFLPFRIERR